MSILSFLREFYQENKKFTILVIGMWIVLIGWYGYVKTTNAYLQCVQVKNTNLLLNSTSTPWYCNRFNNATLFYVCNAPYACSSRTVSYSFMQHLFNSTSTSSYNSPTGYNYNISGK